MRMVSKQAKFIIVLNALGQKSSLVLNVTGRSGSTTASGLRVVKKFPMELISVHISV